MIIQHFTFLFILIIWLPKAQNEATTINNSTKKIDSILSNLEVLHMKNKRKNYETTISDNNEWPEFPPRKDIQTTTIKPKIFEMTTESISDNSNELKENNLNSISYCFCDITSNACDINCCCDPDCNVQSLQTFQCKQEYQTKHQYELSQHTIVPCEERDSWFCIIRTNVQTEKNEVIETNFNTTHFYTWPKSFISTDDYAERSFYKYGDVIQLINLETKLIKIFELPSSSISSHYSPYCNTKVTVEHLKSHKSYCLVKNKEELLEIQENFIQLTQMYNMMAQPNLNEKISENEFENLIQNIQIKYCYISTNNCSNTINVEEVEEEEDIININTQYQLKQINIKILHNYTQIKWCLLELWFKEIQNITMEEDDEIVKNVIDKEELWLEWNVEFHNKTLEEFMNLEMEVKPNTEKIVSGPLGYLINRPIIISSYEEDSNVMSAHKKIKYFHAEHAEETSAHTLTLFRIKRGQCYRPMDNVKTINYGINEMLSCTLTISNDSTIMSTNQEETNYNNLEQMDFTSKCLKLQNAINYQLFGVHYHDDNIHTKQNWLISKLGRPQNDSKHWLNLTIKNTESMRILGHYNPHSNTFTCHNMLLNINYEFHMITKWLTESTMKEKLRMINNIEPQSIIERATLVLGERRTLKFKLNEPLKLRLVITIRFFNFELEFAFSCGNILIILNIYTLATLIVLNFNKLF